MIRIRDHLAGDRIRLHCVQSRVDLLEVRDFIKLHKGRWLGFDTESTGLNCYRPGWKLRTAQWGNACDAYVVPAQWHKFIEWAIRQPVRLIGHNGPHDIRCIDEWLGFETGIVCEGETYIPSHHVDSRNQQDGGTGHGLKELSIARIDPSAGKWEKALKEEFKLITVRVPGEFYKSGQRKGQPKYRKARLAEGWGLIDPFNRRYLAYAAADPILTYRLWFKERHLVKQFRSLYKFDHDVQVACDRLQRRGMRVDVKYTERLSRALTRKSNQMLDRAWEEFGCANIQSTDQVAAVLIQLGAELFELTPTGRYKVDASILRALLDNPYSNAKVKSFIHCVLIAKQLIKRRESYTESMLREMDKDGRVHTSLNSLAARTSRMSASNPPLQQLPTKDHEDEIMWESEEEIKSLIRDGMIRMGE